MTDDMRMDRDGGEWRGPRAGGPGMRPGCRLVRITPELASRLLESNDRNRSIHEVKRLEYAKDMADGRWRVNGATICFDWNGRLIDGQHRLRACVKTGIPLDVFVIDGLDPESILTIDGGAARNLADVLRIEGESCSRAVAALATADARWNLVSPSAPFGAGSGNILTRTDIHDWYRAHADDIRTGVRTGKNIGSACGFLLSQTMIGVLWLNLSRIDSDDADDFFQRLADGAGLEEGSPILTLRNTLARLKAQKDNGISTTPRYKAAITLKAWNRYRRGERAMVLAWHGGGSKREPFPTPDGWTTLAKAA